MADFGKNYPLDGIVGAVLRVLTLGAIAFLLGTYASTIAATEGISFDFGRYRAWVFFIPAFTAAGSGVFALRTTYWIVAGLTAGEKQLMVWRRSLLLELLYTGLGGFCLLLGNVPGMAWDLGPFGMIVVIVGLGFLGNPQAVLIDGASRRFVTSGFFYASVVPFGPAALGPLCIVSRPSGYQSWYLGLGGLALSPPITREEAERVAVYARARTGFGPAAPASSPLAPIGAGPSLAGPSVASPSLASPSLAPSGISSTGGDVTSYLALESTLRALHGEEALYVKPTVWTASGRRMVAAGWAFLDGAPAILPTRLDLLTISSTSATGALEIVGREPGAVLALLGARVERHEQPCPHVTVRVAETDKPALLAQIAALPDHRPGAAPSTPAPSTPAPSTTPEGFVHARQHRLLAPSVPFQTVNDALYAAGFKSVLPITELEPEAAIWERPGPVGIRMPRIVYERDAKLDAKKLVVEWLAPRDLGGLATIDPESIDLSTDLAPEVLRQRLAQLTWLTASTPGWSGLPGAIATVMPHPAPGPKPSFERSGPPMVCYADPSPVATERVAALKSAADPGVASAALDLEQRWQAQRAMNERSRSAAPR